VTAVIGAQRKVEHFLQDGIALSRHYRVHLAAGFAITNDGGFMMKKLALTAAALFAFSGTAQAQMVRAQDPSSVVRALQGAGYKAEVTKDDTGDPLIRSTSSGSNFAIFFFGCTKNVDCTTIQFFAGYDRDKSPTLSQMNDWNSRKRFARAYISDKGAARIEMDVDIDDGGISTKLFEDNLEFWVLLMSQFEKHIDG
jgi:hypothetical protein